MIVGSRVAGLHEAKVLVPWAKPKTCQKKASVCRGPLGWSKKGVLPSMLQQEPGLACSTRVPQNVKTLPLHHVVNDSPHPHDPFELGLMNTNSVLHQPCCDKADRTNNDVMVPVARVPCAVTHAFIVPYACQGQMKLPCTVQESIAP
jgi:hypothetical protein